MKDRNVDIVIAIGLIVIVAISVLIIYGSNEVTTQSIKATDAVNNLLLQQKDFEIKKLVKCLDAKEKELNDTKALLGSVKERIDSIKTDISK